MVQAFAALFFLGLALSAIGMIAFLLRSDWEAFTAALGLGSGFRAALPNPPQLRARPARRATVIRVEPLQSRPRAAA